MRYMNSSLTQNFPSQAEIVVIGGGITGASLAYHLVKLGCDDVVLVDQGPLWETGGSTSHAPGLVFQLGSSRTMTRLARDTVSLLRGLEHDGKPCFHPVGGLEVATTRERHDELRRRHGLALSYGLPSALLTPEQAAELAPTSPGWSSPRRSVLRAPAITRRRCRSPRRTSPPPTPTPGGCCRPWPG